MDLGAPMLQSDFSGTNTPEMDLEGAIRQIEFSGHDVSTVKFRNLRSVSPMLANPRCAASV